ncbi:MAG TPA: cbb3-type cytochrome c oxidase N-terminal domain-containing protein [Ignavibacteria bacterium]|nr:cbb3-type cytochrome c oxidase N-terminal domain-containing protein [Ignavibacteria bacterium]
MENKKPVFKTSLIAIPAALFFFMITSVTFAQTTVAANEGNTDTYNTVLLIVLLILFNLVFLPLLFPKDETVSDEIVVKDSAIKSLKTKLYGLVPLEQEHSILLEDNFDGIRELDNKVPPWFNILFYGTVIFAFIYLLDYHVLKTGKLPFQEYADEVNTANMKREELIRTGAFINENNVTLLSDAESLNSGKQIFAVNCTPCHGANAEGTVGPNLTDQYWIHGGGVTNIFKTVKYGVPVKGMISWQTQLNPKKMQMVVSYVMSLAGTNPPNGKIPEGNLFTVTDSTGTLKDSLSIKTENGKNIKKDTASVKK